MSTYAKGNKLTVILNAAATKGRCGRLSGVSGGYPLAIQSTDGTTATAHDNCLVFLQDGVSGDLVEAQIDGLCEFVTAGAANLVGKLCTTDANGKAVAAASGDRAFLRCVGGKADTGNTADGAECRCEFVGPIGIA